MKTKRILVHTLIWLFILLALSPLPVFAQDQPAARRFGQEELDQMLAPIALYPDSLLAQILMAATYPLEVVQADRWAKANTNLPGDQLNDALDSKNWDPSVKALAPFPQVLAMMSERLEWTQKLGDAFLDQEDQVMDTVQKLRARAEAAGNLRDTEQQRVIVEEGDIVIEPAQPDIVFVPVYDPFVIYGPWWYPAFPPFFFPPPRGVVFVRGFGFWPRIVVGRAWGHAWGHWDWRHHSINVNVDRRINVNRNINVTRSSIQTTQWQHDVSHRKGVSYRNETTRERYGQSARGAETRRDFRGFGQETKSQQAPVATRQGPVGTKAQQDPVTTRQGLPETKGRQVSGAAPKGPTETKGLQGSGATSKGLPETKGVQASGAASKGVVETKGAPTSGVTSKGVVETKGLQGSGAAGKGLEQPKRTTGLEPKSLDLSKTKSPFVGMERGSDVRTQSNRGQQSRQSMSPKGPGGASQGNVGQGSLNQGNVNKGNVNKGNVNKGDVGRGKVDRVR